MVRQLPQRVWPSSEAQLATVDHQAEELQQQPEHLGDGLGAGLDYAGHGEGCGTYGAIRQASRGRGDPQRVFGS